MNNLISVIVPIYKVEKYLRRCIDSILAQTYKNFELILVDDGSPDKCPEICDEYAKKDNRIMVIHKKNGGLSSARNAGLDIAKGEYIGFVDSDDFIAPDMYEKLLKALIKSNADFAECNSWSIYETEKGTKVRKSYCINNETITPEKMLVDDSAYIASQCNKLFKAEIFNDLRYPEGKLCEDTFVTPKLFHNRTVVCISDRLYYNTVRTDSITGSMSFKCFMDAQEAYRKTIGFYIRNEYPNKFIARGLQRAFWNLGEFANRCTESKSKNGIKCYKQNLLYWRAMLYRYGFDGLNYVNKLKLFMLAVSPKYSFKLSKALGRTRET